MIGKILVGTDASAALESPVPPSSSQVAVEAAAQLAQAHGAELVILGLLPELDPRPPFAPDHVSAPDDQAHRVGERFPQVKTRTREALGQRIDTLYEVARQERADLIVVAPPVVLGTEESSAQQARHPAGAIATGGVPRGRSLQRRSTARLAALRTFYSRAEGWLALAVSAVFLTYGGGAVMFWLHAIERGERGPAISDWSHWLLDSTLGFVALSPVLFFVVPFGAWAGGRQATRGDRRRLWVYIVVVGTLFALMTGPGPLLHNAVAGAGTPVAGLAMRVFGHDAAVAERSMHAMEHSPLTEGLLQVAVGVPVYIGLTWLALCVVRAWSRSRPRAGG